MKRLIFLTITLVAATVSCTKSGLLETPQTYEDPISFEPYSGKIPVTKATEATLQTMKDGLGFHVTGFLHSSATDFTADYLDVDVTFNSSWGYDGVAYWPEGGSLDFVAYGLLNDVDDASPITFDNDSFTAFTYVVPEDVADQQDLVVSGLLADKKASNTESGNVVKFQFEHVLSRVGFSVKTNNDYNAAQPVNVTIKQVTLNGTFVNTGDVDLTSTTPQINPEVAATTNTTTRYSLFDTDYAFGTTSGTGIPAFMTKDTKTATPIYPNTSFNAGASYAEPTQTNETNRLDRFMMIMPGRVGDLTVDNNQVTPYIEVVYQLTGAPEQVARVPLTQTVTTGSGETATTTTDNWTFVAGRAYEFIFTVSTTAIVFDVEMNSWSNPAETHESTLTPEIQ